MRMRQLMVVMALTAVSLPLFSSNDLTVNGLAGSIKRFAVGRYYEGALHSRSITIVDQQGFFTEVHTFDASKKTGKMVFQRGTAGKLNEVRFLTLKGALKQRVVYQYAAGGQPRSSVSYDTGGKVSQTTSYTYDSSGRVLSLVGYAPDQKKMFEIYHEYDSDSRLISSRHLNYAGGLYYKLTFEYRKADKQGNWTKRLRKSWSLQDKLLGTETEKRVFEYR